MVRRIAIAAGSVTLLALAGCAAAPLHTRSWVEVRTPNFVILSPQGMDHAKKLARELELFRSVVAFVTGQRIPRNPVPLRVYAFGQTGGHQFFENSDTAGYIVASMRDYEIALRDTQWATARQVLQHEYVHFLLRNHGVHGYPPWYDEGFAEFLSSVDEGSHGVDIGRPQRARIESFPYVGGWISLSQLLSTRSLHGMRGDQVQSFYAESWALVHYLYLGRKGKSGRSELTRYLNELRSGADDAQAIEAAFDVKVGSLGRSLVDYIKAGRYPYITVPLDRFEPSSEIEARELSPAQSADALGRLAAVLGLHADSEAYYTAALAADPHDPNALTGRAAALAADGRSEEAEALHQQALAAAPEDALVHLDYANTLLRRAREEPQPAARTSLAARAREHYVRSWKLDDTLPETYAGYGSSFLVDGEDPLRGQETLEHAHHLLPSSIDIKLALARLYIAIGRRDDALELALVVATWSHSGKRSAEIESLLDDIRRAEALPTGWRALRRP